MIDRTTKLRWRRRFKQRRQQVEDMGVHAEQGLEKHFFKRYSNLIKVRRFVISWLLLMVLLIGGGVTQIRGLSQYYQELQPAPGGTLNEGVIGMFTTANPLYATTAADSAVARLVFSGLLRYDQNNQLVGDVAESISVDPSSKVYTVKLRQNVQWHDGKPLTAADAAFTYKTIQNPDARSPLFNAWNGIQIATPDAHTVVFTLPNALSTFPESLTNGLVPAHVLATVQPTQLRTVRFNSVAPIGSGPFKWEELEVTGENQENRQESIGMVPNDKFYRSPPKLQRLVIRTFRDEGQMIEAYKDGELTSMVGLSSVPDDIRDVSDFNEYNVPLAGEVAVFFKNSVEPFTDVKVRRALVQAVDVAEANKKLSYPAIAARGPLLSSHIGYDRNLTQLPLDVAAAAASLDKAGWIAGPDGIRMKGGMPLTFKLHAQNTSDYVAITGYLQQAWRALGVKVEVTLQTDADIQALISRDGHNYQALLYGISLGGDPDVFAYWHSSQADPRSPTRLNLSEYKNREADLALEAGRTRSDPTVRATKYKPFLEAWRMDAPALTLYQPNFLYVTRGQIHNFGSKTLTSTTDRFTNVENWMIRQERVTK